MAKASATLNPPTETKGNNKPLSMVLGDPDVLPRIHWSEAAKAPYNLKGVHSPTPSLDMLTVGVIRTFTKNVEQVVDGKTITIPKTYEVAYDQDYVNRSIVRFFDDLGLISKTEEGDTVLDEGMLATIISGNDIVKGLKRYLAEDVARQLEEELRQEELKKLKAVESFVAISPAEGVSVPQRYIELYHLTSDNPVPEWILEKYGVEPEQLTYFPVIAKKELVIDK